MATSEESRARKKLMITGGAVRRDRRRYNSLTAFIRRHTPGWDRRERAIKERRGLRKRLNRREKRQAEQRQRLHEIRALRYDGSPRGLGTFDGYAVCNWIIPYLVYGRATGIWDGVVTSGHRSDAYQAHICNSPPYPRPCAPSGTSRHRGNGCDDDVHPDGCIPFPSGAVDVTDPEGLNEAIQHIPDRVLFWAGAADPPHFSTGNHKGMSGY